MLQILANGIALQIGQPIPKEIANLSITYNSHVRLLIHKTEEQLIRKWLTELIHACTQEYIYYNNTYLLTLDLKEKNPL